MATALIAHHTEIRSLPEPEIEAHIDLWARIGAMACEIDPRCKVFFGNPNNAGARLAGYLAGRLAERERQKEVAANG